MALAIGKAGVIHTDLREYNIYRVITRSQSCRNSGINFSSSSDISVDLKIIDWDDSVRINRNVPEELLEDRRRDSRFPHDDNAHVATMDYHDFFIDSLEAMLAEKKKLYL